MEIRLCLIVVVLALSGCSIQRRPNYEQVTYLVPDCANRDGQIRYLNKMTRFNPNHRDDKSIYDQTISLQIERLKHYCQ
jgi:hypothetical protein